MNSSMAALLGQQLELETQLRDLQTEQQRSQLAADHAMQIVEAREDHNAKLQKQLDKLKGNWRARETQTELDKAQRETANAAAASKAQERIRVVETEAAGLRKQVKKARLAYARQSRRQRMKPRNCLVDCKRRISD